MLLSRFICFRVNGPVPYKEETCEEGEGNSELEQPRREFRPWDHDKYKEMDQAPKTDAEIVASYGYDIRKDDTKIPHPPTKKR